jgi:hypothetical protein
MPPPAIRLDVTDWIHLTSNSGLRLRCDDPRITKIGPMALPFLVVETQGKFRPLWSNSEVRLQRDDQMLLVEGVSNEATTTSSLKEAAEAYSREHPLQSRSSPIGKRLIRAVTLDLWLPDGRIAHTYQDALDLIKELQREDLAADTLLYLPGWSGPFDTLYPQYKPALALGGEAGFGRLVEASRDAGIIFMPHLNFWGYDIASNLIPNYSEFQVHDKSGNPLEWPGILRTGFTNRLAYMRVDDQRWMDLFFSYVDPLVNRWNLEALFLDQIGSAPTVEIISGSIAMLERFRSNHQNLILGGEIMADFVVPYLDVMQAWGLPWCGLETDFGDSFSSIVQLLFGSHLKFMGHLGLPCAQPCRYVWTNYPFLVEKGTTPAFEEGQRHLRGLKGLPHVRLAGKLDPLSLVALKRIDSESL